VIGTISVEGLEIECIIGILPHERENLQLIYADIEVDADIAAAAASDAMDDSINYVHLADLVRDLATEKQYQLIETLVEDSARDILARWPEVERVALKVMKPEAIPEATWTAVRIERKRQA
jgi:7,8-dihydroneopterin aldolase/epimerase/oxygenase